MTIAWSLLRAHWKLIATASVILALSLYAWRLDSLRAGYKTERDQARREYAAFRVDVAAQTEAARIKQLAVNAAKEREWKDRADDADKSIDDLRARLRLALVRPQAGGSAGGRAGSAPQADGPRIPERVPPPTPGDTRSVQVDADILAGLAAYAIQAHEWALSLTDPN